MVEIAPATRSAIPRFFSAARRSLCSAGSGMEGMRRRGLDSSVRSPLTNGSPLLGVLGATGGPPSRLPSPRKSFPRGVPHAGARHTEPALAPTLSGSGPRQWERREHIQYCARSASRSEDGDGGGPRCPSREVGASRKGAVIRVSRHCTGVSTATGGPCNPNGLIANEVDVPAGNSVQGCSASDAARGRTSRGCRQPGVCPAADLDE